MVYLNTGVSVPLLMAKFDKTALFDPSYIVAVYVSVVLPSCAVTLMVITFIPGFMLTGADAVPDATGVPFTVTVAVGSVVVGVTVVDITVAGTAALYLVVPAANAGDKLPAPILNPERVATVDTRVTVME